MAPAPQAGTSSPNKRQKLSDAAPEPVNIEAAAAEGSDASSGFSSAVEDELASDLSDDDVLDDSEEDSETEDIKEANARKQGLIKTSKRKRALSPETFGQSLVGLLSAPEPSAKALAKLNKPLHPTASDTAIERKALKLVQHQRHEQREHAHVKDVIAGWGPRPKKPFSQWTTQETSRDWVPPSDPDQFVPGGAEGEKVLRKLAQRGTVKLFNAIRAAQGTTEEDLIASARAKPSQPPPASIADELRRKALPQGNAAAPAAKTSRSGSATTSSMPPNEGQDLSHVPNLFGTQAKEAALANLSKESFLSILKGKPNA